jgi:PHD/YefM family antitoxin component YafN of YafNO toxin-antitoxin module
MKVVTVQQLEADFDAIFEDVVNNKEFYRIQNEGKDVMLIPYEEYEVLKDTYHDWVECRHIDAFPLPVEYVADAEPEKIN